MIEESCKNPKFPPVPCSGDQTCKHNHYMRRLLAAFSCDKQCFYIAMSATHQAPRALFQSKQGSPAHVTSYPSWQVVAACDDIGPHFALQHASCVWRPLVIGERPQTGPQASKKLEQQLSRSSLLTADSALLSEACDQELHFCCS